MKVMAPLALLAVLVGVSPAFAAAEIRQYQEQGAPSPYPEVNHDYGVGAPMASQGPQIVPRHLGRTPRMRRLHSRRAR
jgi:hypothetical protein